MIVIIFLVNLDFFFFSLIISFGAGDKEALCEAQTIVKPFSWITKHQLADYWHYVFSNVSDWDDFDPSNPSPE